MSRSRTVRVTLTPPVAHLRCRAFSRHDLDGHVFEEQLDRRVAGRRLVWVARLECAGCGTQRIDVMMPRSCELISRLYVHPDGYDGKISPAEARRIIFKHMLDNGVSLASLAG